MKFLKRTAGALWRIRCAWAKFVARQRDASQAAVRRPGARRPVVIALLAVVPASAFAQSASQQRVYGAASITTTTAVLPGFSKDSATGTLATLPNSPFADRFEGGLVAIDGQGRFLFVLNATSNNISMYQIDSATGALSEVPKSPFAAGPTVNPNMAPSQPISLTSEPSGKFLYVGYASGDSTTTSALAPFAIDAANLRIVLTPQLSLDFGNGAPIQLLTDPKGLRLYIALGPDGGQFSGAAGTLVYAIDATTGVLTATGSAGGGSDWGRAIAMDALGRFFFDAWGQSSGVLESGAVSPVDGTSTVHQTIDLGASVIPELLLTESSGKFLYAQTSGGLLIYSIDQSSGNLTLAAGPLVSPVFAKGTTAADSMGPYIYSFGKSGVDGFQVDPLSGKLAEISGAPFATGASSSAGSLGLAISGTAAQNVSGPAAQLFPTSQDFGQITVGQTGTTKILSLVNTGGQTLTISGILVIGTSGGDFAETNTCGAALAANANCSVSIVFTPSQASAEQATLQVSDNAPGSPQTAALTGTGVAAQASLTISPASVNFGTIQPGAIAPPQTVTITNSGTAALHVSSVALSGANPGDFSQTNTCVGGAVAVQASCAIAVNFTPQAAGQRTASLVLTDDGTNSPQSVAIMGTSVAGQGSAAISPASVSFAAVAQGATSAAQTVTVTNTGTSALHISAVALSGANAGDFSQTSTCMSGAIAIQASCAVTVSFTPQAVGQRTASLVLSDDAANSPQSIALSGSGVAAFQLSVSGSASATVSAGQMAQYTLQVAPGPGFSGNVSFQCSGAPSAANCVVSPASVAISNGNSSKVQVSVTTTGASLVPPVRMDWPRFRIWPASLSSVALLAMLLWRLRRGLGERRGFVRLAWTVAGGIVVMYAAGCGGGAGAASDPPPRVQVVTPKGTSTLTVTAQSGTLPQQTIQLTLTVN